jgi:DNA replication protein DnaC
MDMEHLVKILDKSSSATPNGRGGRKSSTESMPREQLREQRARAALAEYAEMLRQSGIVESCRACGGSGVTVDAQGFGQPCPDCESRRRSEVLQAISGLNPAERCIRLDDVQATGSTTDEMISAARLFLVEPHGILTLWGGPGNAKTMVLQAIINECLGRSTQAVYITLYDLAGYVREAFKNDSESAWRRVRRLQSVRVLCIDEFDKVKPTEWIQELETAIIDHRYRNGLAGLCGTVIAMNESPEAEALPMWIVSRLRDGRNRIVHNTDPDVRAGMSA